MSALSLARTLSQRALQQQPSIRCTRRWFAEVVSGTPSSNEMVPSSLSSMKAVNWRKERVPVRDDHGLYAFFRRKEPKDGETLEGEARFEVVDSPANKAKFAGRGWKAEELRLKSFMDLHTLWYVLVRERNLLATQKEEARRMGVTREFKVNGTRVYHVQKSMARIKQILNERRLAYEKAYDVASAESEAYHNAKVLSHLRRVRRRRTPVKAAEEGLGSLEKLKDAKLVSPKPKAEQKTDAVKKTVESPKTQREIAAETAASSLVGNRT